jgi:hypothetical protein
MSDPLRTLARLCWDASSAAVGRSAGVLASVLPAAEGRAGWRELDNKLAAFRGFERAAATPPPPAARLDALLAGLAALSPYDRLWATEGLGYAWAEVAWNGGEPRDLLAAVSARAPLATGMGLCFASRIVGSLPAAADRERLASALARFLALARDNAPPGWIPAVAEAWGFAARTLRPDLVPAIGHLLAADAGLSALFWHGVGRGLYFAPTHAVPLASPSLRAVDRALSEPPHAAGRSNAVAGFALAMTLVNFRHPEVVETFLAGAGGGRLPADGSFGAGVGAAVSIWERTIGREGLLRTWFDHRPAGPPGSATRWDRCVLGPAAAALANPPPAGDLFCVAWGGTR